MRRVEKWPIRLVLWMAEFFMARTIFNDPVHFYCPFIGHRRVRLIYYLRLARNFEWPVSTAVLLKGHVARTRGFSTLVGTRRVSRDRFHGGLTTAVRTLSQLTYQ